MSDILFWNEARRELDEKKLLNKCNTFVDSLMANDYIYPHPYNETKLDDTTMDNVAGNSLSDFNRQLKKFTKLLNNRLSEAGVSAIDDNFTYHHKFVDMKGNNKGDVYLPFTLMLDDGQILLALAKLYEGKEAERKSGYQVVKWFLNEEDITKAVYGNKAREILSDKSYNELAKSISVIIKYNHKKFIKKNGSTLQKVLKDLEKENEELKARRDELLDELKANSVSSEDVYKNGVDTGLSFENKELKDIPIREFEWFKYNGRHKYKAFAKKFKGDIILYNGDYYTFNDNSLLKLKENSTYKKIIDKLLQVEQLGNSEELENKYMIGNMGGNYIVSDKTIMENGDYKRVASINKYNGKIEFEKDVNKNEIMEFIAPFIENKFPKDKELDEDLTEVSEDPLVDTKETGAKVDEELGKNPKITAKNIAEFYPNMSDEELSKLPASVFEGTKNGDNIFKVRLQEILETLNEDSYNKIGKIIGVYTGSTTKNDKFKLISALDRVPNSYESDTLVYSYIGLEVFGVKDNLEPIDEYIAKIKASPEYQEYIRENTPQEEEPINEPQDNKIETRLKALLESDDIDYIESQLYNIVDNLSDEDIEKYEELLNQVDEKIANSSIKG